MDACFFHFSGPSNIVGFVEAGFEFHEDGDLLFVLGGGDEGVEDGGISAGAVEGHFDREDLGIDGGLFEERNNGMKTFVGVKEKNISLAN